MKRVHTQPLERLLTLSLALAIPLASSPALAATSGAGGMLAQDPAAEAVVDPKEAKLAEAQRLYKLGEARYELFDFPAAIEFWTEAYGLLPEGENARVRNVLVRNLSVAHIKAFDVDEDDKHLKTAKMLLERYVKELTTYYEGDADTSNEIGEANKTLDEVNAKLAAIEEAEAAANVTPPPTGDGDGDNSSNTVGPTGPTAPTGPQVDEDGLRKGRTLTIAGGALIGLGVVGGGVGILGAVMGETAAKDAQTDDANDRPDTLKKGRTGNVLAYSGMAAGATFLIVGVALLAVGAKKKKDARTARVQPHFAPQLSRSSAGGTFTLEF